MQENANQARPTPSRRRQGRNNGKASARKMYASENDAAAVGQQLHQPYTPQKSASASPEPNVIAAQSNTSKHPSSRNANTNNNKARGKEAAMTPDSSRAARRTPPNGASAAKPTSSTAFAGSTFHASPAPSALPIPSFLAKNVAASPSRGPPDEPRTQQQQPSPPATDSEMPTPQRPSVSESCDSPLEAIFRADRAEKEKARRASFVNPSNIHGGIVSPPHFPPREPQTMPTQFNNQHPRERPQMQRSNSGIPLSELDGSPGEPAGPAFSAPYHERIRAARAAPHAHRDHQVSQTPPREDPSEALKKVLFGPKLNRTEAPVNAAAPPAHSPGPPPAMSRPQGVLAMEDDLRRILKLS